MGWREGGKLKNQQDLEIDWTWRMKEEVKVDLFFNLGDLVSGVLLVGERV